MRPLLRPRPLLRLPCALRRGSLGVRRANKHWHIGYSRSHGASMSTARVREQHARASSDNPMAPAVLGATPERPMSPDVLGQIALIDAACMNNDAEALLAGDMTALSALIDERCARNEARKVLCANQNTLDAFVLTTHAALHGKALADDDVSQFSAAAMVLIPRLAVLDCLEALHIDGALPLELFNAEPQEAPEGEAQSSQAGQVAAERHVQAQTHIAALRAALGDFLRGGDLSVGMATAFLRARLLGGQLPEPLNHRITPLFDALCKVSDAPMSTQARAFTLLLQHTFMSL